ncbi:MAG: hypothetical protein WKF66_00350 [Pedobacter sp.]
MKKEHFLHQLQEELEFEETLFLDTELTKTNEWDSMGAMVLLSFVATNFDVILTASDLKSITTMDSLIDLIGSEKFD